VNKHEPSTAEQKMTNNKPIHQVRIGRIVAAIWENETPNGTRHNVTFSRLYKSEPEADWKRTESFGRDDLPTVEKVADLAFRWIHGERPAEAATAAS